MTCTSLAIIVGIHSHRRYCILFDRVRPRIVDINVLGKGVERGDKSELFIPRALSFNCYVVILSYFLSARPTDGQNTTPYCDSYTSYVAVALWPVAWVSFQMQPRCNAHAIALQLPIPEPRLPDTSY